MSSNKTTILKDPIGDFSKRLKDEAANRIHRLPVQSLSDFAIILDHFTHNVAMELSLLPNDAMLTMNTVAHKAKIDQLSELKFVISEEVERRKTPQEEK